MKKRIRMFTAVILAVVLCLFPLSVTASAEGGTEQTDPAKFTYSVNSDNTLTITGYSGTDSEITVPSEIDGKTVTAIGSDAFERCTGLISINIPFGLTSIGDYAFSGCTGLTSVNFPSTLTSIGYNAFEKCKGLKYVFLPSGLTCISDFAFLGCTSLCYLSIPKGVTRIEENAFLDCDSLERVYIPETVTYIDGLGFYGEWEYHDYSDYYELVYRWPIYDFTIYGKSGSAAEMYARNNGFDFVNAESDPFVMLPFTYNPSIALSGTSYRVIHEASGGVAPYKYYVAYKKQTDKNWAVVQNYTTDTEFSFRPAKNEKYDVCLGVKDNADVCIKKYVVVDGALISRLANTSEVTASDGKIAIKGSAQGGVGAYQYKFLYKKSSDTSWKTIQNYSTSTDKTIIPSSAGSYDVCVKVKDSEETIAKQYFTVEIQSDLKCTSVLSDDVISLGGSFTVIHSAVGGSAPYKYAVYYKKATDSKWAVMQNYTTDKTVDFKPARAVEYNVCLKVIDKDGKLAKQYYNVKVIDSGAAEPLKILSDINKTSLILGETVTVTNAASGGAGAYRYSVYYKKTTDTDWAVPQYYTEDATVKFKPRRVSAYDVCLKVMDSSGLIAKKYFVLGVAQTPVINNTEMQITPTTGNYAVTLTHSAEGGSGQYKYAVYYKRSGSSQWTELHDYSSCETSVISKLQIREKYDICIKAKDENHYVAEKIIELPVPSELEVKTSLSARNGETRTVTNDAVGGIGDYVYYVSYSLSQDAEWVVAQDFTPDKTVTVPADVIYLCYRVRDGYGNTAEAYKTIIG